MKKIVAFDFDGTICDSFQSLLICFHHVFNDFNVNISDDEVRSHLGSNEEGICKKLFPYDDYEEAFHDYLRYYEALHDSIMPNIDNKLRDLLMYLKDKTHLVLVTGRHVLTTQISLKKLHLENIFEKIYAGSIIGPNKDASFHQIMQDYNVKNTDILYIGDSKKDILFCRQMGIEIISVNYYKTAKLEDLEALNSGNVCKSIDELAFRLKNN